MTRNLNPVWLFVDIVSTEPFLYDHVCPDYDVDHTRLHISPTILYPSDLAYVGPTGTSVTRNPGES